MTSKGEQNLESTFIQGKKKGETGNGAEQESGRE